MNIKSMGIMARGGAKAEILSLKSVRKFGLVAVGCVGLAFAGAANAVAIYSSTIGAGFSAASNVPGVIITADPGDFSAAADATVFIPGAGVDVTASNTQAGVVPVSATVAVGPILGNSADGSADALVEQIAGGVDVHADATVNGQAVSVPGSLASVNSAATTVGGIRIANNAGVSQTVDLQLIWAWAMNVAANPATPFAFAQVGIDVIASIFDPNGGLLSSTNIFDLTETVVAPPDANPSATGSNPLQIALLNGQSALVSINTHAVGIAQVPEPTSISLLALGFAALGFARRRLRLA